MNRLADNEGHAVWQGIDLRRADAPQPRQLSRVGDRTLTRLEFAPTPPDYLVRYLPVVNPSGLKIKAGDADAKQVIAAPVSQVLRYLRVPGLTGFTITSALPHMHMLGTTINTALNGQSLLDIGRWQFGWQRAVLPQDAGQVSSSDLLTVECRQQLCQSAHGRRRKTDAARHHLRRRQRRRDVRQPAGCPDPRMQK